MGVKIWDDWILTHIRKSEIEGGEWGKLYERWGRGAQTKKLASRACNHGVTSLQKVSAQVVSSISKSSCHHFVISTHPSSSAGASQRTPEILYKKLVNACTQAYSPETSSCPRQTISLF